MQPDILDNYGILNGVSCLEYMTKLNPGPVKKGKNTFSYSSYRSYWECQLRFFLKYVDKRKPKVTPDSRNALEGGAAHLALENFAREGVGKEPAEWIVANAEKYFEQYLGEMKRCVWKSQTDKAQAYVKYLELVARGCLYIKNRVRGDILVREVSVEKKFVVKISPKLTINGIIDLLLIKGVAGGQAFVDVVDWKGGSSRYVSKEQLMMYGLAAMGITGLPVGLLAFAYLGSNEQKTHTFTDSDYEAFIYKLIGLSEGKSAENRVPTKDIKDCKWCIYKDECEDKP